MTRGKLVPVASETKLLNVDKGPGVSCPACGAMVTRFADGSCGVCGKLLREGFQPLDAIRSSHRMQRVRLNMPDAGSTDSIVLFEERRSLVSNTAWACTVYSMVPYIGVVFILPALLTGGFSYFRAAAQPGRRGSATYMHRGELSSLDPAGVVVAALPDSRDRHMKIATIVSSNSHIDYIARVIDAGDERPNPSDHCFGQFVALGRGRGCHRRHLRFASRQSRVWKFRAAFGTACGTRRHNTDFVREQGILIGILLLGTETDRPRPARCPSTDRSCRSTGDKDRTGSCVAVSHRR